MSLIKKKKISTYQRSTSLDVVSQKWHNGKKTNFILYYFLLVDIVEVHHDFYYFLLDRLCPSVTTRF